MIEQPEALRLFTNQLLDCDGKPNGVHVGCDDLEICKNSCIEGKTSPAIHEWVDAAELRRLHAVNQELGAALRRLISYCNTLENRLMEADGEHPAVQEAKEACAKVEGKV